MSIETRPPLPPFSEVTAKKKVRGAEEAWSTRDPEVCARVYTEDTRWRNRAAFRSAARTSRPFCAASGRANSDTGSLIAVRFAYEWHDDSGHWFRSYGNENWAFNAEGFMTRRYASINDLPIAESERKFFWPLGRRPDDHPGLSELGL